MSRAGPYPSADISLRGRQLWAEIDLAAVGRNLAALARQAGPRSRLLAVVKANAYGHGALPVARACLAAGVRALGVATVDEGVQLREGGITAEVLVLGYTPPGDAERIVAYSLTPTITSKREALAVAGAADARGVVQPVHLKVDTGMHRLGLAPAEAVPFAQALGELHSLRLEGIYSHFANADSGDLSFNRTQFEVFRWTSDQLPEIKLRHIANTAALFEQPETALEMVRPGIGVYGYYPSSAVSRPVVLTPALSLKSRIARLHTLAPGETVSYNRAWRAEAPALIALVPAGYGDGLPRALSNRGHVLIRGQRAPIRGRVCMDACLVEVTHISDVALDDEVVLLGHQRDESVTIEEWADWSDTIHYEVLCGISARVPRLYFVGETLVQATSLVGEEDLAPVH